MQRGLPKKRVGVGGVGGGQFAYLRGGLGKKEGELIPQCTLLHMCPNVLSLSVWSILPIYFTQHPGQLNPYTTEDLMQYTNDIL